MRDSHAEWTVVYLGRRFSGAQIADAFVASLERNKRTASQVSDRRAATLIRAALTLRRTPDDIVLSVMVSPLLLLLWPLLRRAQ